jgi:hypothetical protein
VKLGTRLARVEEQFWPLSGCETCCGWTEVVLEGDDGPHRPEACPACGRVVLATLTVRIAGVAIAAL